MKTRIYFVRHGEVHNPKNIWYGRMPYYRLTEKGRQQIENTAKLLLDKRIEIIYSSPLLRTRQSAEIIRKKIGLEKVYFSKGILEVRSSLQGRTFDYLAGLNFDFFASPEKEIIGETLEELSKRMQSFIRKISRRHRGKNIVVVSHGDPIMIIRAKKEGLPTQVGSIRRGNYLQHGEIYLLTV